MLAITYVFFTLSLLVNLSSSSALEQEDECGGPLSTIEFDNILEGFSYFARCTQPTYKLNVDCILSSCPCLSGLCPIYPNGSIDANALNGAVSILNACIRRSSLICGINMSHTPMVQVGCTTKELLPTNVVNGTMHLNPGTGFLDNLSCANFRVKETDNPLGSVSLHIRAPNITNQGYFNCTFNVSDNSFLRPLKRQLLTTYNIPNSINTPNMFGIYRNAISSLVCIDLCSSPPTINILDDQSDIDIVFKNFASANGLALPECLVDIFNRGMLNYIKNSVVTTSAINFLSTYVALGLRAAQLNCS